MSPFVFSGGGTVCTVHMIRYDTLVLLFSFIISMAFRTSEARDPHSQFEMKGPKSYSFSSILYCPFGFSTGLFFKR